MTFELIFEPRHYNRNCGCMIPEAWSAFMYDEDGNSQGKWPCGSTRKEAEDNVRREYPEALLI